MSLEPWIEYDKRRRTYVVRWRDASRKQCRDEFSYDKAIDARARKQIIRDRLRNQSLGQIDLTRTPAESLEKYAAELEAKNIARRGLVGIVIRQYLAFKDSNNKGVGNMADITREHLLEFHTALHAKGRSQHTISTYMGILQGWLKWCVDHKWLPVSPYHDMGVQTPKKLDRYFTDSELMAFENVIENEEFRCVFRLGYECGLRPGEIRRITQSDVLWDEKLKKGELSISPDEGKTDNAGRIVPLPGTIYALMPREKALLFGDWTEQRMNRHYLRAKAKAGIQDRLVKKRQVYKTFYWTRHTYAKRYLENGGSLRILSYRMGHASIKITADTYGHLEREAIKEITVPSIFAGQPSSSDHFAGHRRGNSPENRGTNGNIKILADTVKHGEVGGFVDGKIGE